MTWASSEESYRELNRIGFRSWELVPLDGGDRLKPESGTSTKRFTTFFSGSMRQSIPQRLD